MKEKDQLSRIIKKLDEISTRSAVILNSYQDDGKAKGFDSLDFETYIAIEEVLYPSIQGYPGTEDMETISDDIDDFYQQQGETTYSIFHQCHVQIIEDLLDIGLNIEIEFIFAFFAHSRSGIVSQRIQKAYEDQNNFNDTLIHTWEETCGLLEALNVAEKICLTKKEVYKNLKKEHVKFKSPVQITSRKKAIPKQLERLKLKEKAFEIFLDTWTTNPEQTKQAIIDKITPELDKIEQGFATGDDNRTIYKWVCLFLDRYDYWKALAHEDGQDIKDVARDYFSSNLGKKG